MKVVLHEKVGKLGQLGDVVEVKSGYARNYLFPQSKAVLATKDNIAIFEQRRKELEAKAAEVLKIAKERASKLEALKTITVAARASEEGKLYGSIGTNEIAHAIIEQGVEVKKSEVCLPEGAIRLLGDYEISLQLHSDVVAHIVLNIIEEKN